MNAIQPIKVTFSLKLFQYIMFGRVATQIVAQDSCVCCTRSGVRPETFRTMACVRRYMLLAICQECQDLMDAWVVAATCPEG